MEIDGRRYSFTQAVCTNCWLKDNTVEDPESGGLMFKQPTIVDYGKAGTPWPDRLATCCWCGHATTSGIFIRIDPSTVPHPTPEEE